MKKAYLNWSSGKDAAYALYRLQQERLVEVEKLVTTINSEVDRVSMHGLRRDLLIQQANKLNLPLHLISLPGELSMADYNKIMERETLFLRSEGFTHSVFGDILLDDLKEYREQQLQKVDLHGLFPLWKKDTAQLMNDFLSAGFKAITVSVNAKMLNKSFCGRIIDHKFLEDLPSEVDPAGENGEFHTFVFDGPNFSAPVNFQKGEIVEKFFTPAPQNKDNCFQQKEQNWDTHFYYCDLF